MVADGPLSSHSDQRALIGSVSKVRYRAVSSYLKRQASEVAADHDGPPIDVAEGDTRVGGEQFLLFPSQASPTLWPLYAFLVSVITPCFIIVSGYLEPRATEEREHLSS